MSTKGLQVPVGLVLLGALACAPWKGPDDVARQVEQSTGESYDREVGLTLGRLGLALARSITEDPESEVLLRGVRKVEVGVYTSEGRRDGRLGSIDASSFPDWTPIAEVSEAEGERVLVLVGRREDGAVRRLLVLVVDEEELTVVRLRGRLDEWLEDAVRTAFSEIDRTDLAEPALAEIRRAPTVEPEGP